MKIKFLIPIILTTFLLNGCITFGGPKEKPKEGVETYRIDLDNDMMEEIVEVEDRFNKDGSTIITITKPNKIAAKKKVNSFSVAGRFTKIEFIDLNDDALKQIALLYETKDNSNLVIYSTKNNKLNKIFAAQSNCGIDTQLDSPLARVKIGKSKSGAKDCSSQSYVDNWEVWVWSGEKFIKER